MIRLVIFFALGILGGTARACEVPTDLSVVNSYADPQIHAVVKFGIWAVWYHPEVYDHGDAKHVAKHLSALRCEALDALAMKDPIAVTEGIYVNVYLHSNEVDGIDDGFDNVFADAVGWDDNGILAMELSVGAEGDPLVLDHEGFHVFQYASQSPWERDNNGYWYAEASAEWYTRLKSPDAISVFGAMGTIMGLPHYAMWVSSRNRPADATENWLNDNRQYAMHAFLLHLQTYQGLTNGQISEGYYNGTQLTPQEYFSEVIGKDNFKDAWADFAANVTASLILPDNRTMLPDWILTRPQRQKAVRNYLSNTYEAPLNHRPITLQLDAASVGGGLKSPETQMRPMGYGYNVVEILNPLGRPKVQFQSKRNHDYRLRLIALENEQWRVVTVQNGDALALEGVDSAFLVVAYTPDWFAGLRRGDYAIRLSE